MSGGIGNEYVFCIYILLEDYRHMAGEFNLLTPSGYFTYYKV